MVKVNFYTGFTVGNIMTSKYVLAVFLSAILLMSMVAITMQSAEAKTTKKISEMSKKLNRGKICGDRLCTEPAAAKHPKAMKEEKMTKEPMMKEPMKAMHEMQSKAGTLTSVQDPGVGHESHQLAIILPPTDKVYKGILSYSASENIQLVALTGPLKDGEDKGQAIWTPDGKTKFALTFVDPANSMGTWVFTGNALAVHTKKTTPFQVSYSVVASQ